MKQYIFIETKNRNEHIRFIISLLLFISFFCACINKRDESVFLPKIENRDATVANQKSLLLTDCDSVNKIELTDIEIKYRNAYLAFYKSKSFSASQVPFYPYIKVELPAIENIELFRIFIGKETLSNTKDYVLLAIPFKNSADTCCCIKPGSFSSYALILRPDKDLLANCNIEVYNLIEKTTDEQMLLHLIAIYQQYMKEKLFQPTDFPYAFTFTRPTDKNIFASLIPQHKNVVICKKNNSSVLKLNNKIKASIISKAENSFNIITIPKIEKEKTKATDCCQVPPMEFFY